MYFLFKQNGVRVMDSKFLLFPFGFHPLNIIYRKNTNFFHLEIKFLTA